MDTQGWILDNVHRKKNYIRRPRASLTKERVLLNPRIRREETYNYVNIPFAHFYINPKSKGSESLALAEKRKNMDI